MTHVMVVALSARTGGGGSHLVNQLAALSQHPSLRLTVHAAGETAEALAELAPLARVITHPRRALVARILFEQTTLAWRARYYDVLYVPGNLALLLARTPQVVCQQNAWYFTPAVRAFRRRYCSRGMRLRIAVESAVARASVRRARCVIAVSAAMKQMLEADLGAQPQVRVITSAAPQLAPAAPPVPGRSYALAVAADDPHKDLSGLVRAFARNADLPRLVVVGRASDARRAELEGMAPGRIAHIGQLDDREHLADLYGGAACLVAHSHFESFGMTPAEALLCGTPVAATDIAAHREVCGDRARYYAPDDPQGLADAVHAACAMPRPQPELAGRSWVDNAAELANVLTAAARSAHDSWRSSDRLSGRPHRTRSRSGDDR